MLGYEGMCVAMEGTVWPLGNVCGYERTCLAMRGRVWL